MRDFLTDRSWAEARIHTIGQEETLGELNTRVPERLVSHSEADFDMDLGSDCTFAVRTTF